MNVFAIVLIFLAALFSFFSFIGAAWITGKITVEEKKYWEDRQHIIELLHDSLTHIQKTEKDHQEFLKLAIQVLEEVDKK